MATAASPCPPLQPTTSEPSVLLPPPGGPEPPCNATVSAIVGRTLSGWEQVHLLVSQKTAGCRPPAGQQSACFDSACPAA